MLCDWLVSGLLRSHWSVTKLVNVVKEPVSVVHHTSFLLINISLCKMSCIFGIFSELSINVNKNIEPVEDEEKDFQRYSMFENFSCLFQIFSDVLLEITSYSAT